MDEKITLDLRNIKNARPVSIDLAAFWHSRKRLILIALTLFFLSAGAVTAGYWYFTNLPTTAPAVLAQEPTQPPMPQPTATAMPAPTPTDVPLPAPVQHSVVWTNNETGIFLRDTPGGKILLAIPNGEETSGTGGGANYGGLQWIEIAYQGQTGWIATQYVYQLEGDYMRIGSEGVWSFKDKGGIVDFYLWKNTPYQIVQAHVDESESFIWLLIRLPDGTQGWIKEW